MRPPGPRRRRVEEREPAAFPHQTQQEIEVEALAVRFGLAYLSAEGLAKLTRLLAWVLASQPAPPDLIKPPPERFG